MTNPTHTVPFTAMSHGSMSAALKAAKEFSDVMKSNCYDVERVVSTRDQEVLVIWKRTVTSQVLHDYTQRVLDITKQYKEHTRKGITIDTIC